MLENLSLEVDSIQGIGPKIKTELNTNNIHTLLDFLAVEPGELHELIDSLASEKEVNEWHDMALLMQADVIDAQFAEALVKHGVTGLETVANATITELSDIFEAAKSVSMIPELPTLDEKVEMIRQTNRLVAARTITGKILDEENLPLSGVKVSCVDVSTNTNANGLFRLSGLQSENDTLFVSISEENIYTITDYTLERYADSLIVQKFVLNTDHQITLEFMSEYEGDILPEIGDYPMRVNRQKGTELRKGDLFLVRAIKKDKNRVDLQSIFNDFDGSKFLVNIFEQPADQFPEEFEERDYVVCGLAGFRKVNGDRSMVKLWKEAHRNNLTNA